MTPDANAGPPTPDSRRFSPALLWAGVGLIALVAVGGWYGVSQWQAAQTAKREAGRVGALHEKLAVKAQPLTGDEFDEVLALTATADPEARFVALLTATAHAQRHRPDLKARVLPVAERLTNDPEPAVRQKAVQCRAALAPKPAP